jgi:hypothetical protein
MSIFSDNDSKRDARLTAVYREAAQDAPPPALDAAILAAARREVGARPRPAGRSFARSWRAPMSIAAVIVLSVSLVTLMREEAPEIVAPPRADSPTADIKLKSSVGTDDKAATEDRGFVREEEKQKNIGLNPPQPASPSGLGMRQPEFTQRSPQSKHDFMADRAEVDATGTAGFAKRRVETPDAAVSTARQAGNPDAPRDFAQGPAAAPVRADPARPAQIAEPAAGATPVTAANSAGGSLAENKAQARQAAEALPPPVAMAPPPVPAAAAKPVAPSAVTLSKRERTVDLPPEKWLERIEELRKFGRLDEAKASLAEFRKRYPDYQLPVALRDWATP